MRRNTSSGDYGSDTLLLTVADVARLTGWSTQRVYQLIAGNKIPHVRIGRSIRIPVVAWQQWLDAIGTRALESITCTA